MFVAYIITKTRDFKLKIVRRPDGDIFTYKDFEYRIDMSKQMVKKFLWYRPFYISIYFEGNPEPIDFKDGTYSTDRTEVPLNEIAILVRKARGFLNENLTMMMVAGCLILLILLYVELGGFG